MYTCWKNTVSSLLTKHPVVYWMFVYPVCPKKCIRNELVSYQSVIGIRSFNVIIPVYINYFQRIKINSEISLKMKWPISKTISGKLGSCFGQHPVISMRAGKENFGKIKRFAKFSIGQSTCLSLFQNRCRYENSIIGSELVHGLIRVSSGQVEFYGASVPRRRFLGWFAKFNMRPPIGRCNLVTIIDVCDLQLISHWNYR